MIAGASSHYMAGEAVEGFPCLSTSRTMSEEQGRLIYRRVYRVTITTPMVASHPPVAILQ